MIEPVLCQLVWKKKPNGTFNPHVLFPTKGGTTGFLMNLDQIDPRLRQPVEQPTPAHASKDKSGRPCHIRPVGQPWEESAGQPATLPSVRRDAQRDRGSPTDRGAASRGQSEQLGPPPAVTPESRPVVPAAGPPPARSFSDPPVGALSPPSVSPAAAASAPWSSTSPEPRFHNPYSFVPVRQRDTTAGELGDRAPTGHDRFHDGHFTGRVVVLLKCKTPLLIPDAAPAKEINDKRHKSYPIRLRDGMPLVPSTSIKGMLRSAYEAVTNSRFGVFSRRFDKPLTYRMEAKDGLALVPVRIIKGRVHFMMGFTFKNGPTRGFPDQGRPPGNEAYAAWLPSYHPGTKTTHRLGTPPLGHLPAHGELVRCWVEKVQHHRWNKKTDRHERDFTYWRVLALVPDGQTLGPEPKPTDDPGQANFNSKSYHKPLGQVKKINQGWACITNRNISTKHDERVFFHDGGDVEWDLGPDLTGSWADLIADYQQLHEDELKERLTSGKIPTDYLGDEPGKTAFSRHTYEADVSPLDGEKETLCYAEVDLRAQRIKGLYPVIISRKSFLESPLDCLPASLRPAATMAELSPADRVFGWVGQDAQQHASRAFRGQLRIGAVRCLAGRADEAIESFGDPGLPLAVLGQPKPQQTRFYLATKSGASPSPREGVAFESSRYRLRGRKVYPHHGELPTDYWDNAMTDRTQKPVGGPKYQEYRRPHEGQPKKDPQLLPPAYISYAINDSPAGEQRDSQNRSIQQWVRTGTAFEFPIDIVNLSHVEFGALLFLLSLPGETAGNRPPFLRLGGGKPLGLGSVQLSVTALDVSDGEALRSRYGHLTSTPPQQCLRITQLCDPGAQAAIESYKSQMVQAYDENGRGFEGIPLIAAFLRACWGHADAHPVHYPRARQKQRRQSQGYLPPHPEGKAYEWFVANQRGDGDALPELTRDDGLRYHDKK
jgi:CRISPR-associated protein (TIGR03986 family)